MNPILRRTLTLLAALIVAVLGLGAAAQAAPSPSPSGDLVKVYVVKSADQNGGQKDTLSSIAQRTVGDANRADEIFQLNKGLPQADGSALNNENEDLHPGWILRLPDDASGSDVQQGRLTNGQSSSTNKKSAYLTWKLILALVVALILGAVTLTVVFRRRVGRGAAAVWRGLTRPITRRMRASRRQQLRRRLRDTFASDRTAPDVARRAITELLARTPGRTEVYAVSTTRGGLTAWLTTSGEPLAPWRALPDGRWERAGLLDLPPADRSSRACPVRVGADEREGQVFVDLSWLDGVLAVDGDPATAVGLVTAMAREAALSGLQVAVLGGNGLVPGEFPVTSVAQVRGLVENAIRRPDSGSSSVVTAVRQRVVTGLVVVPARLPVGEAQALLELCADAEAGPVALMLGTLPGAHWQWHVQPDGALEIPTLTLEVTLPD